MAGERGDLLTRVAILERELQQLRARMANLLDRPAQAGDKRNPRLCITAANPEDEDDYPDAASGTICFWIKFVDGTFTESVGPQTAAMNDRQAVARFKGLGPWVAEGTPCWALFDHGRWWLSPASSSFSPCELGLELADPEEVEEAIGEAEFFPVAMIGGCLKRYNAEDCTP